MRVRLALLILALLAAPLVAEAQQAGNEYKIGLLTLASDPTRSAFWQRFLEAMRELDYVEGRNLIVKRAFADGKADRLQGLVAHLTRAKVDAIVATSTQETLAARRATSAAASRF
jgi:ABC-type sugar transport system substrate-binding protein